MQRDAGTAVSKITLPDPYWRYLILFQSWPQFLSCTLGLAGLFSAVATLIWLFGDVRLIPVTLTGGLLGCTPSLLATGKAQFSIKAAALPEQAAAARVLEEWNYVEKNGAGQDKRFRQNLPSWLRWNESDVTIGARDGAIVYTGPQLAIRVMRKAALSAARRV